MGELLKCEIGESKIFNNTQDCSSNTSGSSARATADIMNKQMKNIFLMSLNHLQELIEDF